MLLSIKHIDRLSLHDMPYLLQPYKACNAIRNVVRDTGRLDQRPLYSSDLYGLEYFIDQHIQRQQRYGFQMQYGNTFHNSLDDPISEAIQVMISRAEAFIIFSPHGLRYDPLLIPPEILEQKNQHWSLDTGIQNSLSFINNPNRFGFIMEKRFRELGVAPDPETGKIIATGRCHMSWMHTHPYAYRLDEPTEPTPPEPQLRPMEAMPPTYWVELKHQLNFQDDKGKIEPAAGVPFKLTLPDGKVETGKLDSNGFASFSGIKPGTCSVEYDPEFENDLKTAQQALQDELNQLIATRQQEKVKWDAEFDAKSTGGQVETLGTAGGRGFKNSIQDIAELLESFAKIKQDPTILPRKAIEGYQSGKQLVEQIREIPDDELKAYAIIASDPKTWKMLSDFSGDYLDTLTAEEVAELGGAAIPDLILLVVTGGSGTAASAGSKLSKLKHIKKLLMELVEVLKRKPAVGTNSGLNDTVIKSTNRLRAGEGGTIGAKNVDELFSNRPTSFDPMDETQFSKIQEAFKRQGKVIDNSEDALRYLETRGADGVTFNAETILVRPDASPSTVFEELIHTTQHRTGRYDQWIEQYGNAGAVAKAEHEAAQRLVKNQLAYGISDAEHAVNIDRVKHFGSELKKLGVPRD